MAARACEHGRPSIDWALRTRAENEFLVGTCRFCGVQVLPILHMTEKG